MSFANKSSEKKMCWFFKKGFLRNLQIAPNCSSLCRLFRVNFANKSDEKKEMTPLVKLACYKSCFFFFPVLVSSQLGLI